jgi:hypothetical protein
MIFYCDRECQTTHWKAHKVQCKLFQSDSKNMAGYVEVHESTVAGEKPKYSLGIPEQTLERYTETFKDGFEQRAKLSQGVGFIDQDIFRMGNVVINPEKKEKRVYTKVFLSKDTIITPTENDLNLLSMARDALLPLWQELLDPNISDEEALKRFLTFCKQSEEIVNIDRMQGQLRIKQDLQPGDEVFRHTEHLLLTVRVLEWEDYKICTKLQILPKQALLPTANPQRRDEYWTTTMEPQISYLVNTVTYDLEGVAERNKPDTEVAMPEYISWFRITPDQLEQWISRCLSILHQEFQIPRTTPDEMMKMANIRGNHEAFFRDFEVRRNPLKFPYRK